MNITLPEDHAYFKQYRQARVIPRDLFNEALLLKSIGQLVLLVLDQKAPEGLTHSEYSGEPFDIQGLEDGSLVIRNLAFYINGKEVLMKTIANRRASYPLECEINYEAVQVFENETGEFTPEFLELFQ